MCVHLGPHPVSARRFPAEHQALSVLGRVQQVGGSVLAE